MKEHHIIESYEDEIEDNTESYEQEEHITEKTSEKLANEQVEFYETETEEEPQDVKQESRLLEMTSGHAIQLRNDSEVQQKSQENYSGSEDVALSKNVDPDERYLMSCLPAFKRFTTQQKAYVRMGIEKLFYEVEFENIAEPTTKKTRIS